MVCKVFILGLIVLALMMLTVSTALAAKGVITDVNPSGRIIVADGITDIGDTTGVVDGITDVEVIELKNTDSGSMKTKGEK